MALAALRVFVPSDFLAGKPIHKHVGPAVSIDIVSESQEAVGVGVVGAQGAFEAGDGFDGAVRASPFKAGVGGPDLCRRLKSGPSYQKAPETTSTFPSWLKSANAAPSAQNWSVRRTFLKVWMRSLRLSRRGQAGQDRRSNDDSKHGSMFGIFDAAGQAELANPLEIRFADRRFKGMGRLGGPGANPLMSNVGHSRFEVRVRLRRGLTVSYTVRRKSAYPGGECRGTSVKGTNCRPSTPVPRRSSLDTRTF